MPPTAQASGDGVARHCPLPCAASIGNPGGLKAMRMRRPILALLFAIGLSACGGTSSPVANETPSSPTQTRNLTASPSITETAPTPTPTTPKPTTASFPSETCPSTPLRGVYHSYRLHVLGTCRWYSGTVIALIHGADGDYHLRVTPASGYKRFLNAGNYSLQQGGLVAEPMPGQKLPLPSVGERIALFGTWVYDADHGWNEIHPIWAIDDLDTGKTAYALPSATPEYNPGSPAPPGGGGSAGGSGCSSTQGYYASSYSTAYLIYPASNPDWHDLSPTYLRHFCTLAAAQQAFPGRSVDTDG